jgi:hypothetical protein
MITALTEVVGSLLRPPTKSSRRETIAETAAAVWN